MTEISVGFINAKNVHVKSFAQSFGLGCEVSNKRDSLTEAMDHTIFAERHLADFKAMLSEVLRYAVKN